MFPGRQRSYFVDYFCKELITRVGGCTPEAARSIERVIDNTLLEARSKGWHKFDRPLGQAVLNPDGQRLDSEVHAFAVRAHTARSERWRLEGITPSEVVEYWDHGYLSHICYRAFDSFFFESAVHASMTSFFEEGRDFPDVEEAVAAGLWDAAKRWPRYGPIEEAHLQLGEWDRPLMEESRIWVDKWRFEKAAGDPESFMALCDASSTLNAEARRARAADAGLANELAAHHLPAPVFGLRLAPAVDDREPDDDDEPDYEEFIEIPNKLQWPIPVRLGDDELIRHKSRSEAREFTTIPCATSIPCEMSPTYQIQASGILFVGWENEPDSRGIHLRLCFFQLEDLDSRADVQLSFPTPVAGYIVDANPTGYHHDSPYQTEGWGQDSYYFQKPDVGLRVYSPHGAHQDFVIPWQTGALSDNEKIMILTRLKVALGLIDRHLASVDPEALQSVDDEL
jgi:hypothetical protein